MFPRLFIVMYNIKMWRKNCLWKNIDVEALSCLWLEAKLHHHDAWELYYVVYGHGNRIAGDTLQPFTTGDVALIPPSMHHQWDYAPSSADREGCIHYLMVAFAPSFVQQCVETFPELRNRMINVFFPTEARTFGMESSRIIRKTLSEMNRADELERLCIMLRL